MTTEEVITLDLIRSKMVDNYKGKIKGSSPLIVGSMNVAYSQGASDMLRLILENFELTKKTPPQEAA